MDFREDENTGFPSSIKLRISFHGNDSGAEKNRTQINTDDTETH